LDDKNLPVQAKSTQISIAPKVVPGILVFGGLAGVLLTPYDLIFALVIISGISLFITRALVRKSVEATSGSMQENPFMHELKLLEHTLAQTKYLTKMSSWGEKAFNQAKELHERCKLIDVSLNKKFSPSELAFSRYQNAVSAATQSLSANLKLIASTLTSMDVAATQSEDQINLVKQLLSDNAETLKLLSELSHSLNQINAGGTLDASLEHSMTELKRLTEQAKKYSR
jgi:hypothetical protein